jgi:hypothetical protein
MESQILLGDCREVLKSQPDNHFDSVVTDPPSGIKFLGLEWDTFKPAEGEEGLEGLAELLAFQNFLVVAFREVYRVLKPGGFGLVWALPRSSHHTKMALERVGFEIRDTVYHVFGCLSEDTELLTENGWEKYSNLRVGTLAMCYDITTKSFSWQPIQEVYVYPYDDTAYSLRGDTTQEFIEMSGKNGYVGEHRLLVARILRRCLTRLETVHHINHNPKDNRVENLMLFATNRDHKLFERHGSPPPIWSGLKLPTTKEWYGAFEQLQVAS